MAELLVVPATEDFNKVHPLHMIKSIDWPLNKKQQQHSSGFYTVAQPLW